ncbi:MAG: hypothetical protein ACXWAC_08445 [Usitatibacter sp.]
MTAPESGVNLAALTPEEVARLQQLYHRAMADLVRGRADLARDAVAEFAGVVRKDPATEQLLRLSALVGFDWPLPRAALALERREPPSQENLDLVAFHVDLPVAPSGIHNRIDYMAVLAQSFESARIRAPRARRLLITDEHTAVPATVGADRVLRFPLDRERVMYERMRLQELYLEAREPGRATVLMDSDVVVNRDPAPIFEEGFDVGLTWRANFPDAPFNGGMIFVAEGDAGLAFVRKARACYDAIAEDAAVVDAFRADLRAWWGDQFALAAFVGYRAFAERQGDAMTIDGVRMRFFPCDEYNFTIEPSTRYSADELRRKFFIHFKGNRKALQTFYLENMRAGRI